MSSQLRVDNILPSASTALGIGTAGGSITFNSNISGNTIFNDNVTVGGVLTYEDVTYVDSVGIITARSGVSITSGQLTLPDSIVHAGNDNAKIRFPATDTFTVETSGSERLRISSNGRVHVTDGDFKVTDGNSGLLFEESNNGAFLWLDGANGDFSGGDYYGIAANNSAKLQFGYAGAADLVLNSAGSIGIGTDNPGAKLHVEGYVKFGPDGTSNQYQGLSLINGRDSSANVSTGYIDFRNNLNTIDAHLFVDHQTNGGSTMIFGTSPAGDRTSDRRVERLRITDAGKIGIGHHSAAQITKELTIRPANDGGIMIGRPGDTVAPINAHLLLTTTTAGQVFPSGEAYTVKYHTRNCDAIFTTFQGGGTGGNISFQTGVGNGNSTERLRIQPDGNISIGGMAANAFNNYTTLTMGGAGAVTGSGIDFERSDGNIYGRIFGDSDGLQIGALQSGDYIRFEVGSGTERARITSDGLTFNGNTSAANALDDYEEGVFTPVLSFAGGTTGITYTMQEGHYTKIGRQVIAQFRIQLSSEGSSTGTLRIGLPFTALNTFSQTGIDGNIFVAYSSGFTQAQIGDNPVSGYIEGGTNYGIFNARRGNGDAVTLNQTDVDNDLSISATAFYYAAN